MALSLNALFPSLEHILGETPGTLRAFQRSLVREGLLESVPGKGPGSGVPGSAEAMAQFLIGICCQATRLENVPYAQAASKAAALGGCTLTSKKTFGEAFAAILGDRRLASRVQQLTISTNAGAARISYDHDQETGFWKPPRTARQSGGGIQYSALIWGPTLVAIANELAQ